MKVDSSAVAALYRNELRHLLRDRRTIVMSIVLPLLVMPIMLFGSRWMEQRRQAKLDETVFGIAVAGSHPDAVRDALKRAERAVAAKGETFRFREVAVEDAEKALADKKIHLILRGATAAEVRAAAQQQKRRENADATAAEERGEEEPRAEALIDGVPVIEIVFRADRDESEQAHRKMRTLLRETRREKRNELIVARGFPVDPGAVAQVTASNVATAGQVAGLTLGRLVTALLLLFSLSGGAVVATDSLAGEKERGTLETLLTSGVSRLDIVAAKLLAIFSVALLITLIQVANLLVYVGFKLIPAPQDFAAAVPPQVAALLFVLYLPMTALVAAALLLMSGHARSYKEAQLSFFPVFLLGMLPSLAPLLPGVSLRSAIVLVPIAGIAVAAKEILVGVFDWPMLLLAWLVNTAAAALVARLSIRALSNERLISPVAAESELVPGPVAFQRKVLRNFAIMWALLLAVGVNISAEADVRVQIAVNLGVIFLGGILLMVRVYGLDPREVFALRPVKPVVWLAVLIGAPAGVLTGLGVFQLANLVVPVPPEMLKSFGEALLPQELPFWQVVVFLCIAPGVVEELTFRGALLHGLRRRFHPVVLALVVGLVFGLFHTSLFRIAPTAFVGLMLSAVTLLTGSIFPAMLWHALNNFVGLTAARYEVPLEDLDAPLFAAAALILAAAYWIIWRTRSVYPDLRKVREPSGRAGHRS